MGLRQKRSQFYRSLATLEEAGVTRIRALQQHHPQPYRRIGAQLARQLADDGLTLSEAMRQHRLFTPFEINATAVGERTGRLHTVFAELADWYQLLQRLQNQVISGLIYPVLLYHAAAVILPAIAYFTGAATLNQALLRMVLMIGIPDGLLVLYFLLKPLLLPTGLRLPRTLAAVIYYLPLIGSVVHKLNYTRFFKALALMLDAGAGMPAACRFAGGSCSNTYIRSRFMKLAEQLEVQGCTFTEAFTQTGLARDRNSLVVSMMQTGEQGGAVVDMASRIAAIYSDEVEQSLKRVAILLPFIFYAVLAVYIAIQIVQFYQGLFEQYQSFM